MKTFTFQYDPHPRKSAISSIQKSMRTGHLDIQKDVIVCKNIDDMMKLMTKSRFQIFAAIVERSPESITELAESLDKDPGNVVRDTKVLKSLRLIELLRRPGRHGERLKPIALYDRIVFECEPKREKRSG